LKFEVYWAIGVIGYWVIC